MFQVCKKIYFFFLKIVSYFLFISALTNFLKIWAKNKNTDGVIVISLTEHIGDIIASEPIISRYFKNNGNHKIIWVVNKKYSYLVKHNPNIDYLIFVDSMSEWIYLKKLLKAYKIKVFDLHVDQNRCNKYFLTIKNPNSAGISIHNYYNFGNLLAVFCHTASIPILNDTPIFYFPVNYQISDENKHLYNNISEVSFMIFRTGSVLIVGKCDEYVLLEIYEFLKIILNNEYKNICQKNIKPIDNNELGVKDKKKKLRRKNITIEIKS
jgi:hypothetical protein